MVWYNFFGFWFNFNKVIVKLVSIIVKDILIILGGIKGVKKVEFINIFKKLFRFFYKIICSFILILVKRMVVVVVVIFIFWMVRENILVLEGGMCRILVKIGNVIVFFFKFVFLVIVDLKIIVKVIF